MARINLAAKNDAERRILAYLEENASEALAGKINAGGKSLADALAYCSTQARKTGGGCVCVPDDQVFGWVVHYFEDEPTPQAGKSVTRRRGGADEEDATGNGQEATGKGEEATGDGGRETGDGTEEDNQFAGVDLFRGGK